jgi:hypothetical protein
MYIYVTIILKQERHAIKNINIYITQAIGAIN